MAHSRVSNNRTRASKALSVSSKVMRWPDRAPPVSCLSLFTSCCRSPTPQCNRSLRNSRHASCLLQIDDAAGAHTCHVFDESFVPDIYTMERAVAVNHGEPAGL